MFLQTFTDKNYCLELKAHCVADGIFILHYLMLQFYIKKNKNMNSVTLSMRAEHSNCFRIFLNLLLL